MKEYHYVHHEDVDQFDMDKFHLSLDILSLINFHLLNKLNDYYKFYNKVYHHYGIDRNNQFDWYQNLNNVMYDHV
jgi:hypothetical protein